MTGECLDLQFSNSTDREVDHDQQVIQIYFRSKVKVNMTFNVNISFFTNITCCIYLVAICRHLNKILVKLTTQFHGHMHKCTSTQIFRAFFNRPNNYIFKTITSTHESILKIYAHSSSITLHKKSRHILRDI